MVKTARRPLALALILAAATLLAGCFGGGAGPDDKDKGGDGADPSMPPVVSPATFTAEEPVHAVGDWYTVRLEVDEGGDNVVFDFTLVAIEADRGGVRLAVDGADVAKYELAYDLPFVGALGADLSGTGLEGPWELLEFPMRDGATWSGKAYATRFDSEAVPLAVSLEARFENLTSAQVGSKAAGPGFVVTGMVGDEAAVSITYAPAMNFPASVIVQDLDTETAGEVFFALTVEDWGQNWTGTWHAYEGTKVLDSFGIIGTDPGNPGDAYAAPILPATFDVTEGTDVLYGFLYAFAFGGVAEAAIASPDGKAVEAVAVGAPDAWDAVEVDWAAPPVGTWGFEATGAGAIAVTGGYLWNVLAVTGEL